MFTIPSHVGNEIATTGLQNDQSGTITMIVDDMFPFPGDIDLFSANTKCGYIFMFNTGGPAANHSMTLLFKGASTSAPDQQKPQFHLASISCVQYFELFDSQFTHVARCQILDRFSSVVTGWGGCHQSARTCDDCAAGGV